MLCNIGIIFVKTTNSNNRGVYNTGRQEWNDVDNNIENQVLLMTGFYGGKVESIREF